MRKITGISVLAFLAGTVLLCAASSVSAAVDRVLCVPWMGNANLPHTAISGQSVNLYAVIYGGATGGSMSYSWDFKDGTANATGTIIVPANGIGNLQVSHTYASTVGTPYDTQLTVDGKSDIYKVVVAADNTDSRTNIAIDKALWYLHKEMIRWSAGTPMVPMGYWNDNNYYVGRTGASVWAFEVQGHLLNVEATPLSPVEDPYVEDVQRGINYILNNTVTQAMNTQTKGHPEDYDGDADGDEGNGKGLIANYSGGHTNYEQGLAMGALSGSGSPLATAATGPANVFGRTYRDIVQDMVDWYSWSQIDGLNFPPTDPLGGWFYTAGNNLVTTDAQYGDNSASQWAYIGMESAVANFGAKIPLWVKTQLAGYLHGQIAWGNRGFVSYRANDGTPNVCLTGGALVGMALVGESAYDALNGVGSYDSDLAIVKNFLGTKWLGTSDRWEENWNGHRAYYTMYALMKGFRLQGIDSLASPPGTTDWYRDYVSVMLPDQKADGHWRGTGWMDGYIVDDMGTAFGVLILTPSVFSPPPVACYTAQPNPGYIDVPIIFNPSCSYHSDATKSIVLYEWDFDNDGIFDASSATPVEQTHEWDASYPLGSYPVTLRVTDNSSDPVSDTYVIDIDLTLPPHPPVSDAGGPYMVSFCSNDSLKLDGSGSYDIDEGQSESGAVDTDRITAWDWDLDGAPWDYSFGSGTFMLMNSSDVGATFVQGANPIGLRVTDNTSVAYPGSGQPDLTSENFDTVTVVGGCLCNLTARPKSGKVQLTWSHSGAASYDVYRSTTGPNSGFALIADNIVTTYATYLDRNVVNGTKYWYRIVSSAGCGSQAAAATPPVAR